MAEERKFEGINFKPSDVKFPKYALIGCYGKAEAEEAMARIITMLQQSDKWHELRFYDLMKQVKADIDVISKASEIQQKNSELEAKYIREQKRLKNRIKRWRTGSEVVKEPTYESVPEMPEFTLLLAFGPEAINTGVTYLLKEGLVEDHYDEEQYQYIMPTKKALEILKAKGFVVD